MIAFGKTLREAREAKGLTISQIAETTHMMSSIVRNLEDEDFSKIVAPIYGRGFVKLYCEAVGIDAKPLVAEFMEIYNGNRMPEIKERPVQNLETSPEPPRAGEPIPPAPEPIVTPPVPPVPEPETVPPPTSEPPIQPAEEPVVAPEPPLTDLENLLGATKHSEPKPADDTPLAEPDLFSVGSQTPPREEPEPAMPTRTVTRSRYAPPEMKEEICERKPLFTLPSIRLPANFWRLLLLAIVIAALIGAVCFGLRALYRATTDKKPTIPAKTETPAPKAPAKDPVPTAVAKPQPAAKPAPASRQPDLGTAPSTSRTPQKIPSLFID